VVTAVSLGVEESPLVPLEHVGLQGLLQQLSAQEELLVQKMLAVAAQQELLFVLMKQRVDHSW